MTRLDKQSFASANASAFALGMLFQDPGSNHNRKPLTAPPQLTAAPEVGRTTPPVRASVETHSGDKMSPAASEAWSRPPFDIRPDSTLLLGDAQLREALGVPSDVVLKTIIAYEPPPLPIPHLSRSSIFSDLARTLNSTELLLSQATPNAARLWRWRNRCRLSRGRFLVLNDSIRDAPGCLVGASVFFARPIRRCRVILSE